MPKTKVTVKMTILYKCKNSVRYKLAEGEESNTLVSLYLMNPVFKELGEPKTINIEISHAS